MKKIAILFSAFLLTGCGGVTAIKPAVDEGKIAGEPITLINECNNECLKIVSGSFSFKLFSNALGTDSPISDYVVLTSVDGVQGTNTFFEPKGAYNHAWDGGFNVVTTPGKTTVIIRPVSYNAARSQLTSLEFNALPGGKYFVGSMGWRSYAQDGAIYIKHWHPVIVDLNPNEIVFPTSTPNWKKFCFFNREFGGETTCPNQS